MKNRSLLFSFSFLPVLAIALIFALSGQDKGERYSARNSSMISKTYAGAADYWMTIRANHITKTVDFADYARALKHIDNMPQSKAVNLTWEEMGPDNRGGRTRAILFDKDDPTIMYAGGVSGGLWRSTTSGNSWQRVQGMEYLMISSLAQGTDGAVYVGTGESFTSAAAYPGYTIGWEADGIFKVEDNAGTLTVTQLTGTTNWKYINEMAVNPTNGDIFAATYNGLMKSTDNGTTWNAVSQSGVSEDINIADDGTIIADISKKAYKSTDGGTTWTSMSGGTGLLPLGAGRLEVDIAKDDANYMYAVMSNSAGTLKGVYRSTDGGATWAAISPASTQNFAPLGDQGEYNNTLAIYPNNKNKILVGGINLWTWQANGTWTQVTNGQFGEGHPLYLHVDIHDIQFHPTNSSIFFIGCDGGIFRSLDGGVTYNTMNKQYNTIQYYSLACDGQGKVIGGTQDNSNQYIDKNGNTAGAAREIWVGDGGWAALSQINPEALFVTSQFGFLGRSADNGLSWQAAYGQGDPDVEGFFNKRMLDEATPGTDFSSFVTPFVLWEDIHLPDALDSVMWVADTNYLAGEVVTVRSKNNGYPFEHTLLAPVMKDDEIMVPDQIQTMFLLGGRTAVWMTREALDFSGTPEWFKLGTVSGGTIHTMTYSNDGDYAYIGTTGGKVFRIANLRQAYDSASADVASATKVVTFEEIGNWNGRAVTSISVDPTDNDHVIVTLGNYGNYTSWIYRSTDATAAAPNWASKMGAGTTRLPSMPVYASIIPLNNSSTVLIGNEMGIFATDNISATNPAWEENNHGFERVPVIRFVQQTKAFPYKAYVIGEGTNQLLVTYPATSNYGEIYAGSHGRGAFRSLDYVGIADNKQEEVAAFKNSLFVYPNPVVNNTTVVYNLSKRQSVNVKVYDLNGRLVQSYNNVSSLQGRNELSIDMAGQDRGTYIIQVIAGAESKVAKIIKK